LRIAHHRIVRSTLPSIGLRRIGQQAPGGEALVQRTAKNVPCSSRFSTAAQVQPAQTSTPKRRRTLQTKDPIVLVRTIEQNKNKSAAFFLLF
jgi:hypothetical protein